MINQDNPIIFDISKNKSYKKPYNYQEKAIEELEKHFIVKNNKATILQIPTGGGKTFTAVRWLFSSLLHRNYKIVWIAHRIDLLQQARETMIEESSFLKGISKKINCIIIGGGFSKGSTLATAKEDIILISSQTFAKENGEKAMMAFCAKNKNNKIMFVIDEAHHSAASSLKVFIKRNIDKEANFKLLGLTATPTRTVEKERVILSNLFGNNIISQIKINELIKAGHLAWPKPERIATNLNLEESYTITEATRTYFERTHELDAKFLNAIGENSVRNKIIVDTYLNNIKRYGKTLVFAIDKLHAVTLKNEFAKHKNISVDMTYSGIDNHEEIIKNFKDGNLDVLINISRLTEGFDDPKIQTVFLTRPTQSEILFSQMIGRGLRGGDKGTKDVYLVSFEDHWNQFTGWLDADKINILLDIEEETVSEQGNVKEENKILKTISLQVIDEFYREINNLNLSNFTSTPPFECWPLGWFSLNFESDPNNQEVNLPITRTIIVFSHQEQSWDELRKNIAIKKPTIDERNSLYNNWFYDLPNPNISRTIIDLFIDSCYSSGNYIEPEYYTLENREEASVDKLAKEIYELGGKLRQDYINKWYSDFPLLSDIYSTLENFTEAVDYSIRKISFPDPHRMTISVGEQYFVADKIKVKIPETNDSKLVKIFNTLKANKALFPKGFEYNPTLEWTHRIMKSYFGIAYLNDNKIKINRILNSKDIEQNEELIEFVLYHEMLHFSVSMNHSSQFRLQENKFPDVVSLNSILDRIGLQYDINSHYK